MKKQNYLRNKLAFICHSSQEVLLGPNYVNKEVHSVHWGECPFYVYRQIELGHLPLSIFSVTTQFSRLKQLIKLL